MNSKEEKLLREFVRKTFVKKVLQEQKKAMLQEQQVRTYVRALINEVAEEKSKTVIFEGKDQAKPHPSTAINFLRDAFRKLVPNLEKDYKLLTTSEEQRESFKNHYLAAMIRMFDQADGLSASVEAEDYDDIKGDIEQKASEEGGTSIDDLALEEDLELDEALEEADINIVDELRPEEEPEEKEGFEGDIDKELSNKDKIMNDREKFGAGVEGDLTGRNKAYDSFKNTKSYPLSYYQDLSNQADREEYKKWAIYNLNLLFKGFEQDLKANPDLPNISDPQQQV